MGNYHARFLGGKGAEKPLTYPVRERNRVHAVLDMYQKTSMFTGARKT
jgi:hypothetical protein